MRLRVSCVFSLVVALSLLAAMANLAWAQDTPPLINAPATITAQEGTFFSVTITATSSDPSRTVNLTGPGFFCGVLFQTSPGTGQATGTLSGTPGFTCAGSYPLTFTAYDGFSSSSTTITLTIQDTDRQPTISVPATNTIAENSPLLIAVFVLDPDGEGITSLTAVSSPPMPGSTFTTNATNTAGSFDWATTSAGTYNVTFTASNATSASATTVVTVCSGCDRPPVVTAPAAVSASLGTLITFTVTVADPDGNALSFLSVSGTAFPAGASFANGPGNASGTFSWVPGSGDTGTFSANFRAGNALSGSAGTVITVNAGTDQPPAVTAPATLSLRALQTKSFTVLASDPDGDPISSLTSSSSPATTGSTFTTNASNTAGTFSWTPNFAQDGFYIVTFTASNALTGTAATSVVVCQCERAPVVVAPSSASGAVGEMLSFSVSATDPDGDAITTFIANGTAISAGGVFTSSADHTSGTFSWTPSDGQAGTYSVTFIASNALSATAVTSITVTGSGTGPVVTAPAQFNGRANVPLIFTVQASDPDGDAITSFTASGNPMSLGATFTTGASNTSGTFNWNPGTNAGFYNVIFTATSGTPTRSASATTAIFICTTCGARAPAVNATSNVSSPNFTPISFVVISTDPDGDAITSLTAAGTAITAGGTFAVSASNASGTFNWAVTPAQEGLYAVTFTATSGSDGLTGSTQTNITIGNPDRPPLIGAPFSEEVEETATLTFPVFVNDPDGNPIESLTASGTAIDAGASFVAGPNAVSGTFTWTPTLGQAGTYRVTFTARNALTGSFSTNIFVREIIEARAFSVGSYKVIRLNTGKAQWCVHLEPINGSFQISEVPPNVYLVSPGTGRITEASSYTGKTNVQGDVDNNGIDDAEFCFTKDNLLALFSNLHGRNTVDVVLKGFLSNGKRFAAAMTVEVQAGGGSAAASIAPNPLNPSGTLSFRSERSGMVRVRVFDTAGRLVRTVVDAPLPAGPHSMPLEARDSGGRPLASGVYFYRVEAAGKVMAGRFVVAK
jgi:hypothetical protein